MDYWITTHWPQQVDSDPDPRHGGVWVVDGKRDVIARMRVGDLVWIYESATGREVIREEANGRERRIAYHRGRQGAVALVEVTTEAYELKDSAPEQYVGGREMWWRWYAPTRPINSAGFISRADLNALLCYSPTYTLRGFGERNSGLKTLDQDAHRAILDRFLESHADEDRKRAEATRRGAWGGPGGEGAVHKALKAMIASDPAGALGEPGLHLVEVEYPFRSTGDRIDVLLRDETGRLVAVEIEPDCGPEHDSGPLQCMKYRALLAYAFDRRADEVRAILAARTIAPAVANRTSRYEIECRILADPPQAGGGA